MANTLASELARVQTIVRELEANMDHHQDLPPAAREICGELASRVDRSLRIARSWVPDDTAAHFKPRKGMPSVRKQVRVASVDDTAAALDDGFSWRKYGQKEILGAKYPRSYFRCTHRNTQTCLATKQVQRADADPLLFDVVYHAAHTCVQAAHHHTQTQRQQPPGHAGQDHQSTQPGFQPSTPSYYDYASAPLLSPTSLDWQLRTDHDHAAAGLMEFEDFFATSPESLQWDI